MSKILEGLKYSESHEWVKVEGNIAVVGVSDFAQKEMGDITYVDEALYKNKLSIVFDDLPAARETLDRVREFIRSHPTVYCSTHTPLGYENLENSTVCDLDNPPERIPPRSAPAPRTAPPRSPASPARCAAPAAAPDSGARSRTGGRSRSNCPCDRTRWSHRGCRFRRRSSGGSV